MWWLGTVGEGRGGSLKARDQECHGQGAGLGTVERAEWLLIQATASSFSFQMLCKDVARSRMHSHCTDHIVPVDYIVATEHDSSLNSFHLVYCAQLMTEQWRIYKERCLTSSATT